MLRSIKLVLLLSFVFVNPAILFASSELDREGGPDEFGYYFYDSEEENGPDFEWIDISDTGTPVDVPGDNAYTLPIPIGFDFHFYGNVYDELIIGSNGIVGFGINGLDSPDNQDIPTHFTPNNLLAWCWDDLDPAEGEGGSCYYQNFEYDNGVPYIVIMFEEWEQFPHGPDQEKITAEILLDALGQITFQYLDISENFDLGSCTVGIEGEHGSAGLDYTFNNIDNVPSPGLAILFTLGLPPGQVSISGHVTDICSGDPVEGATVYLTEEIFTITDANGFYQFTHDLHWQYYYPWVVVNGYAFFQSDQRVSGIQNHGLSIELIPDVALVVDTDLIEFYPYPRQTSTTSFTLNNNNCIPFNWDAEYDYLEGEEGIISLSVVGGELGAGEEIEIELVADYPEEGNCQAIVRFVVLEPDYLDTAQIVVSIIPEILDPVVQNIALQPNYFELISFYLDPTEFMPDAADLFGQLDDVLEIVYQNNGELYIPDVGNTIGAVDPHEGYYLLVTNQSTLPVQGTPLDPASEFSLFAGYYNCLGYPLDHQVPVESALAEIEDQVVILMNDEGLLWLPGRINTLEILSPGEGYKVFLNDNVTFQYIDEPLLVDNLDKVDPESLHDHTLATGLPYPILVELSEDLIQRNPRVLEVYDGNTLVGRSFIDGMSDIQAVISWEGNPDHDVSGFATGNRIHLKVLDVTGMLIGDSSPVTNQKFGNGPYAEFKIEATTIQPPLPNEFTVGAIYPNPFNSTTTVPFSLPEAGVIDIEVVNILGQKELSHVVHFEAGKQLYRLKIDRKVSKMSTGIYFLKVKYSNQVVTKKLMLLQ